MWLNGAEVSWFLWNPRSELGLAGLAGCWWTVM